MLYFFSFNHRGININLEIIIIIIIIMVNLNEGFSHCVTTDRLGCNNHTSKIPTVTSVCVCVMSVCVTCVSYMIPASS